MRSQRYVYERELTGSEMTSEHVASILPIKKAGARIIMDVGNCEIPSNGDGNGDAGWKKMLRPLNWHSYARAHWHNSEKNKAESSRPDTNLTEANFLVLQENSFSMEAVGAELR